MVYLGLVSMLAGGVDTPAAEALSGEALRPLVSEWLQNSSRFTTLTVDFVQERQLRALRRPLSRSGKLWITREGRVRWQIDEPPALLLTRSGPDRPLVWIDTKKKTWRRLDSSDDATQGQSQALGLLLQSQAASLATFEEAFTLKRAVPVAEATGRWRLELDLKDRRASLSVKDVFFEIEPATGALHLMEFQLRDGSVLRTRMTSALKDGAMDPRLFEPKLDGLTEAP